jgi:hypothetical protein
MCRGVIASGKFFLRKIQSAADNLRARRPSHAPEVRRSEGPCVGIRKGGLFDCFDSHQSRHFV